MATQVVTVTRAITDGQGRASTASKLALCLLVTITRSLTAQKNCPCRYVCASGSRFNHEGLLVAEDRKKPTRSWETIGVGHMVVFHESPDDGWWEGIVINREGDLLTLRLRDFPKQGTFVRHINTVALVNPA
jgi:hypothetical protein